MSNNLETLATTILTLTSESDDKMNFARGFLVNYLALLKSETNNNVVGTMRHSINNNIK